MKYITKKHKNKNLYLQFDENNNLSVIYEIKENEYTCLLERVIVLEEPEYFLLPNIKSKDKKKLDADYVVNCSCFKGFDKVKVVCSGSDIKFTNNNSCDIELVLSKGQALYGIIERTRSIIPTEPYGCLYVLSENLIQKGDEEGYTFGRFPNKLHVSIKKLHYGFTSAPQFGSKNKVRVDRSVVYNNETNSFEETENYDENNMQNVFPDIEDELK